MAWAEMAVFVATAGSTEWPTTPILLIVGIMALIIPTIIVFRVLMAPRSGGGDARRCAFKTRASDDTCYASYGMCRCGFNTTTHMHAAG